jgi:hypothetical protein
VGGGLTAEKVVVTAVSLPFAGLGVMAKRGGGGCVDLFFAFLVKEYWRE